MATVAIVVFRLPDLPARAVQGAIEVPAFPASHVAVRGEAALHAVDAGLLSVQLAGLAAGDLAGTSTLADTMMLAVLPGIQPAAVGSMVTVPAVLWIALGEMSTPVRAIGAHLFVLSPAFLTHRRALALAALFGACSVAFLHACAVAIAARQRGTR